MSYRDPYRDHWYYGMFYDKQGDYNYPLAILGTYIFIWGWLILNIAIFIALNKFIDWVSS